MQGAITVEIYVKISFGAASNERQTAIFDLLTLFHPTAPYRELSDDQKMVLLAEGLSRLTGQAEVLKPFATVNGDHLSSLEDAVLSNPRGRSELFYLIGHEGRLFAQEMKALIQLAGGQNVRSSLQMDEA